MIELGTVVRIKNGKPHMAEKLFSVRRATLNKDNSISYWIEEYGQTYPKAIGVSKRENDLEIVIG